MDDLDHIRPTGQFVAREGIRYYTRKLQRHPGFRTSSLAWRKVREFAPNAWRAATSKYRQLPSAIIVGAQKAGTTQLYEGLIRHPRCFGSSKKELNYFSKYSDRPLSWYQSQFPLVRQVMRARGISIEASPSYLPSPQSLGRMRDLLPAVAVIVILRDPVARAYSHYQHCRTRHQESRSFADAVQDVIEQGAYAPESGWAIKQSALPMLDYVSRGYYALQIEALWDIYPRQQTLILDSADLFENTSAICQQVFDFLGLDRCNVTVNKIFNRGYYRDTIDQDVARDLRAHYRPYDQLLVDLVGRPFRWMESQDGHSQISRSDGSARNAA
ncbi:MAG TPA: sulfotransferase domain-containing protein [Lacipirellulaceae bacterium]|jgi:hypothetical protein